MKKLWVAVRQTEAYKQKQRPGAGTTSEKVEVVQFGTEDIFHISHYLHGHVLEHQVECSSLERTDVYLFRGCQCPVQAYWVSFVSFF